jgi:hypothetical protein
VGPGCQREREKAGLGWSEAIWAGWVPGMAQVGLLALFLYFFLQFSFSFVSKFYFGFLKMLSKSDLNKINSDHFCTLKSVFKTYKPKV